MTWVMRAGPLVLLAILAVPVGAVLARADWPIRLGPGDWAALRFTLVQALWSAGLSVALAVPLARALARRRFVGREALLLVLGAPFILPVIVAVLGLLAIWGRSGLISDLLAPLGLGPLDIYGIEGVVLAHVFFNLPLATRLILAGWAAVPPAQLRLAAQLAATPWQRFRLVEAPMLRASLPGAFLLVLLLCLASFAVVLTLGGGPRATSVELAIYTALRFEFDPGRAAVLALVQLVMGGGFAAVLLAVSRPVAVMRGVASIPVIAPRHGRAWDAGVIGAAGLFVMAPLVAIVLRGLDGLGILTDGRVLAALWLSLRISALSVVLTLAAALALAVTIVRLDRGWMVEGLGALTLVLSPFVLGSGLFLLILPVADPFALALPLTAIVNALLSLPFALRVLVPALARVQESYCPLAASLGMTGRARLRLVLWPALRAPLGFAAGLSAALSMGDLGVIALFAPVDAATLPLMMHRLMGAYRMGDAAAVGLLLVAVSFGLFALLDKGGRLGRHL